MPHECVNCERTFADGSKEMLSGCPDCGGNKFRFRPGADAEFGLDDGDGDDAVAGGEAGTDPGPSGAGSDPGGRPDAGAAGDEEGRATRSGPGGSAASGSPTAGAGGSPGASSADGDPGARGADGPAAGRDAGDSNGRARDAGGPVSRARNTVKEWVEEATSTGRSTGIGGDVGPDGIGPGAGDADPEGIDAAVGDAEDAAQHDARTSVVSPDDLPGGVAGVGAPSSADADAAGTPEAAGGDADAVPADDPDRPAPGGPDAGGDGATADGDGADAAGDDDADGDRTPDLAELREELNDQFESIRIVEPGQYELNLMELYDRQEYIVSLREDGRYAIEVPETWRDRG